MAEGEKRDDDDDEEETPEEKGGSEFFFFSHITQSLFLIRLVGPLVCFSSFSICVFLMYIIWRIA